MNNVGHDDSMNLGCWNGNKIVGNTKMSVAVQIYRNGSQVTQAKYSNYCSYMAETIDLRVI